MEPALHRPRVKRIMKLHVQPGPLPIKPPYFDWEEEDIDLSEDGDDEEIDLTDLLEKPRDRETAN